MSEQPQVPANATRASDAESGLRALMAEHGHYLLEYTTRLAGGDRGWAEDVVQETFVRAWHHLDRLTPENGSVRGWLLRVARNRVMDGYRAAKCRPTCTASEVIDVPFVDSSDDLALRLDVYRLVDRLPEPQRSAILLTFLADRTTAEAAEMLGVPVGTMKSRVYYGLKTLRSIADTTDLKPAA